MRPADLFSRWRAVRSGALVLVGFSVGIIFLSGCGSKDRSQTQEGTSLTVFVSIPPQAYFVERIGGAHVNVHVMVKPGQSPHTYEPTPALIKELSGADLYFTVGLPFEAAIKAKLHGALKQLRIVATDKGIRKAALPASNEDSSARHIEEDDPHIWLSPPLIVSQVNIIAAALEEADPDHRKDYQRNLKALVDDLTQLDEKLRADLKPLQGRSFFVFHPAFGYFGKAYGLKQEAVELQGKNPSPKQLLDLIKKAREDGVKIIFVQPQFDPAAAQTVARAIGGVVIPLDPLAKDVLKNLEDIAAAIERSLAR